MYFGPHYSFLDNDKDWGVTKMKRSLLYIYNPEGFTVMRMKDKRDLFQW
jgi:hypothetical protein